MGFAYVKEMYDIGSEESVGTGASVQPIVKTL